MKLEFRRKEQPTSVLIAIAIHIAVVFALAGITFHYQLAELFGIPKTQPVKAERLQYIVLPKGVSTVGNGANASGTPHKGAPAKLRAPVTTPTTIPAPSQTSTAGSVSGTDNGTGGAAYGIATGVEPQLPDSRVSLAPGNFTPVPKTSAERVDSVVKSIFNAYTDSMRIAQAEHRDPKDWTWEKNGEKWGVDPQFIHLGKFKIPTAVLAALPIRAGVAADPVANRAQAWMRQDVMEHAQYAITEDEFREAVKRIRERKQKEHDAAAVATKTLPGSDGPVAAMPEHGTP